MNMDRNNPKPYAQNFRRGPFRIGERVQLTDTKGKHYTVTLTENGFFQCGRGNFRHRELIGKEEGTVLETDGGRRLLALRPLISDYVLSMPRGATVVYPKDAGQIIHQADIFPGARIVEAGVGSGALSISLLNAAGPGGKLISAEKRAEFADIARANVRSWFRGEPANWQIVLDDVQNVLAAQKEADIDRVIFDLLDPWENVSAAARALVSGGVILAYVTTTTQMSCFVEKLRETRLFTEPVANETMLRTWHLDGLSVRPDHRMVAHTGFLVTARRLARGSRPLRERMSPPAAAGEERKISERKLRKVCRDVARRSAAEEAYMHGTGGEKPGSGK